VVAGYNANPDVHGILVQLPLPGHVNEQRILDAISQEKDVDGFHPANIGALAMRGRKPLFISCTPTARLRVRERASGHTVSRSPGLPVWLQGCVELLERSGVQISGRRAVVIGRSNIVGTPAALLLQQRDATVTVVHSRTPDARSIVAEADIVVAAIGKPEMVRGDWIKPGAAVIDVGTNPVPVRVALGAALLALPTACAGRLVLTSAAPGRMRQRSGATAWWETWLSVRLQSALPVSPRCRAASAR